MNIDTAKFVRKPFYVDAIQVTDDNIDKVAEWCNGEVRQEENRKYVKVRVLRAMNERQTKAFIGDWVLYAGTSYKVYTDKAFTQCFESVIEYDDNYGKVVAEQEEPQNLTKTLTQFAKQILEITEQNNPRPTGEF